jgi:MOSC domain-containing protein YiiM
MDIVAVNVAIPRLVEFDGRLISTGIYKTPVRGPRRVGRTNIEGDGQADLTVHGGPDKAVYAFPLEHYAFYQEALGRDPFEYGQFGENLTTRGLLEAGVRIGDRYRMGEVLFEVSQPRAPCFKFAIKMGSSEVIRIFLESGRSGFYLRVLEEGLIAAGDGIELAATDAAAPSVAEIHRLYFFDKQNLEALRRAVGCTRLAPAFRDSFVSRLAKLEGKAD